MKLQFFLLTIDRLTRLDTVAPNTNKQLSFYSELPTFTSTNYKNTRTSLLQKTAKMLTRNFLLAALFSVSVLAHPHGPLNPGEPVAARYTLTTRDGDDTDTDGDVSTGVVGTDTGDDTDTDDDISAGQPTVGVPAVIDDDTDWTDNDGHDTDDDVPTPITGVVGDEGDDTDHDDHDTDTDDEANLGAGPGVVPGDETDNDGHDTDTDNDGHDTDTDDDDVSAATTTGPVAVTAAGPIAATTSPATTTTTEGEDTDTDNDGIDTDDESDDEAPTATSSIRPTFTPVLANAGAKENGFGGVAMGVAGVLGVIAVF